jgi:uncharacterized protein (DUF983 family)
MGCGAQIISPPQAGPREIVIGGQVGGEMRRGIAFYPRRRQHEGTAMDIGRAKTVLLRGLLLKCPDCGRDWIYQAPLRVKHHCRNCGLIFQREQGYFTGGLYINLLVTEFLVVFTYLLSLFFDIENPDKLFALLLGMGALLPTLFFHHSRSLWLSIDHLIDPIKDRVELDPDGFASPR